MTTVFKAILLATALCLIISGIVFFATTNNDAFFKIQSLELLGNSSLVSKCNLPLYVNPFDASLKLYLKNLSKKIECKDKYNKSYYYFYGEQQNGITYVDNNGVLITQKVKRNLKCYYKKLHRKEGDDDIILVSSQKILPRKLDLNKLHIDFIRTECFENKQSIYKNTHFYPSSVKVESNDHKIDENATSVVILVLESLSRLNYLRFMPETRKEMESMGNVFYMRGLTKIADNSYPNMAAFLTGLLPQEFPANISSNKGPFDDLPLIWKLFQQRGYKTAFIEDHPQFTLFNYLGNGFRKKPVDWYPRPFWVSIESDIKKQKNNLRNCYNYRPQVDLLLKQTQQFLVKTKLVPVFVYSFYIRVTHNDFNNVQMIDSHYANFIKEMKQRLNSSIFILLGDHGNRYGKVLTTRIGRIEERMPLFAIHLPKKLLKQQPHLSYFLNLNSDRLTTWLDVHTTLLDVVNSNYSRIDNVEDRRSYSLWRQTVPITRTCDQALIPDTYCVCYNQVEIAPTVYSIKMAAKVLVDEINKQLSKQRQCKTLALDKIISAYQILPSKIDDGNDLSKRYEITVQLTPSNAIVRAQILETYNRFSIDGDITRLNAYKNESYCINDRNLRKLCYCFH